ncbi:hypothetical protein EPO04_01340 [Patescibacteria group bacterium]|nr:MAG: hypothetical protein EPO04_01340 [Patescibacteria group bacterium]
MKCPVDSTELTMSERQGIEIDYCPQCRGVWLDRGELDKIIERGGAVAAPTPQPQQRPEQRYEDNGHHDGHGGYHKPHKRKDNWLGELFD